MSEKYWGKVYKNPSWPFKFQAEIYQNETLDDTMSIAKQILRRKFLTAYGAKVWVEKKILSFEESFFVKDYEIVRRSWNG